MAAKLWKGDSGDEVKTLQTQLNQNGYNLDVDGVFGNNTYNAVIDYQTKNKLAVDGVVGNETWGSLNSKSTSSRSSAPAQTSLYKAYDPSKNKAYTDAVAALQAAQKNTPTYAATYDGQLKDLYDQIVNREKFSYDINGDALYKQYANQYQQRGKLAMMDTIGQAAALTGGYGSSYGEAVGQQAYNAYLQQLNDVVPELYQQAYNQYNNEGDRMVQQYGMLGDLRNDEYSKYQDAYNQWLTERNYAQGNADTAYDRGYNQWKAELDQANADRQYAESVRQYNESMAEQKRQFDAQMAARASSGGGGGNEKSSLASIEKKAQTFTDNKKLYNYLGDQWSAGAITEAQWQQIYEKYAKSLRQDYKYASKATLGIK